LLFALNRLCYIGASTEPVETVPTPPQEESTPTVEEPQTESVPQEEQQPEAPPPTEGKKSTLLSLSLSSQNLH
jgi:hypothetical protein